MKSKISPATLKKLQERLKYLETVRKKQIIKEKQQAVSYGDFPYENVEYVEVERKQFMNDQEIQNLKDKINNSVVVEDPGLDKETQKVSYGSKIELKDLKTKEIEKIEIVGPYEIDALKGKISEDSPLGRKLMDKKTGDRIKINDKSYVIDKIS